MSTAWRLVLRRADDAHRVRLEQVCSTAREGEDAKGIAGESSANRKLCRTLSGKGQPELIQLHETSLPIGSHKCFGVVGCHHRVSAAGRSCWDKLRRRLVEDRIEMVPVSDETLA